MTCGFCGGEHEPTGELLGMRVVECPVVPPGTVMVGPDGNGDLIVFRLPEERS